MNTQNNCSFSASLSFLSAPSLQSPSARSSGLVCRSHIFRVGVGEAKEVVLVQVHDDELVCWCQVHGHLGELLVEVAGVPTAPLQVELGILKDGGYGGNEGWMKGGL